MPRSRARTRRCAISARLDFILARERVVAADLIGFSWGTITSALFAARAPERIARLALYAPLYAEVNPLWLDRIADPEARSRLNPRIGAYRLVTKKELTS
jgi:pimeloyl-ACP methyl ester carboxylesterase